MGLDISVCKGNDSNRIDGFRAGSYSGFNAFRDWLAQTACGMNSLTVTEHCIPDEMIVKGEMDWNKSRPLSKYSNLNLLGKYKGLIHLFAHSDCEGTIQRRHTRELWFAISAIHADIMKKVIPLTPEHHWKYEALGTWVEKLMLAVQHDAYLDFH